MKKTTVFSWALLLTIMTASFTSMLGGCKSDPATRTSDKGEECQTTADCTSPLACVPAANGNGGVCVIGVFHVAATAKECAIIACSQPVDCCPTALTPPVGTNCTQLASDCATQGPTSFACTEQKEYCTTCDGSAFTCDNGTCHSHCTMDTDCNGGGVGSLKCSNGQCVTCTDDSMCPSGDTCNTDTGACVPPCQSDGDCPGFQRCESNKCVASGCKTDRECVAATKNVQATCGKDTKCTVPCQTDLECGNPVDYSFYSCINSVCTYTGCDSDKDCELYITGGSDASTPFGSKTHITCRAMTTGN